MDQAAYDRALEEYNRNKEIARKYALEAEQAAQMADIVSNQSDAELYKAKVERAMIAYDNFTRSADLCVEVMQEIRAGWPRHL
ncbi:MAG: hypothetical protein KL839_04000 [Rhizobium sp.]|nr:hypothetical protein [Rhizobium sp.]